MDTMLKWLKAFFGIKPNKESYIRVSNVAHYGGKTPEWAKKHGDYKESETVGHVVHGGHNLVRKFVITKNHYKGRK